MTRSWFDPWNTNPPSTSTVIDSAFVWATVGIYKIYYNLKWNLSTIYKEPFHKNSANIRINENFSAVLNTP